MQIEEYIQIAKEEFPYLFEEYGVKVVFKEEGEGRDWGRDAFGLESDMYKMRIFFSQRGGGNRIFFGPLSASFYVDDPYPKEFGIPYEWVGLPNLLWYLNRQDIDWSELEQAIKKDPRGKDWDRVSFRLQSRLLRPHCPRILEMFSSPEAIAAWKPQHDEFIHKAFLENPRYHPKKARAGRK